MRHHGAAPLVFYYADDPESVGTAPAVVQFEQGVGGCTYGEQLVYDIERLRKHCPAVPVKVILIDVEPAAANG